MKDPSVRRAENRIYEARARISWGDSREEVVESLLADGVSEQQAVEIVEAAWAERDREMRRLGRRDLWMGGVVCALGVAGFVGTMAFARTAYPSADRGGKKGLAIMLAFCGGLVCFGLYKCWRGYDRLTLGANMKGGVSELDD